MRRDWRWYLVENNWPRNLVIGSLVLTVWLAIHLYYYNLLVNLECNTQAAWAQVEAQFQRRFYIQHNLTQIMIEYSQYEKNLLTRLTEMRTSAKNGNSTTPARKGNKKFPAKSSNPPSLPKVDQLASTQLDKLFSNVMLVAEQYPQLKLTENFQQFSKAIVDIETQAATQIMKYNDAVNAYSTAITQFPGNIFGKICGFKNYKFYTPDKEVLNFQQVKY